MHLTNRPGAQMHKLHPSGDFWVIRTPDIWVQVRQFGHSNAHQAARIRGFAAGGPFLKGNVLVVLPCWSKPAIKWNGKDILGKSHKDAVAGKSFVDAAAGVKGVFGQSHKIKSSVEGQNSWLKNHVQVWEKNKLKYRFEFPMGLVISLAAYDATWSTFVAKMPQWHKLYQPNEVGGWCGNFNGDDKDDLPSSIVEKQPFSGPVAAADNLFVKGGSPWTNGLLQDGDKNEEAEQEKQEMEELGDPVDIKCAESVNQHDIDHCDGKADQTACVENFCEQNCGSLYKKALDACTGCSSHFGDSCIMDICMVGNTVAAKACKDQEALETEGDEDILADKS